MTKEEFQKLIQENPELLEGYVPASEIEKKISEAVNSNVSGLKKKNEELLSKVADPKRKQELELARKFKEMLATFSGGDPEEIGPDSLDQVEDLFTRLQNPGEDEVSRETKRELNKLKRELENMKSSVSEKDMGLQEAESFIQNMLTRKELVSKFMDQGCSRTQAEANTSYLLSKANFEIVKGENGQREARLKDTGETLPEFFEGWTASDEAQDLMPAKPTSGGGALGSGQPGKGKMTLDQISQLGTREERLAAMKEHGYSTE